MINGMKKMNCTGCGACAAICPVRCIELKKDMEGFYYPTCDPIQCIECNQCREVCAYFDQDKLEVKRQRVYAAYNKNLKVRKVSSSGGVFSLLAQYIFEHNGIVYGASFFNNYRKVKHTKATNMQELKKLYGSKYLQSSLVEVYEEIQEYLKKDKKVLFTGTACQVAGLTHYLKKQYDNLFLVDVVCHGVPSEDVWKKYLYDLNKENETIVNVDFRYKDGDWLNYKILIEGEKNIVYKDYAKNNWFMKGFIHNLYNRPSCGECMFKQYVSESNLTIGDYWGIEKDLSDEKLKEGISCVLVNDKKGQILFDGIKNRLEYQKGYLEVMRKSNPSLFYAETAHTKREKFFKYYREKDIEQLIAQYLTPNKREYISEVIGNIIKKIMKKPLY